MEHVSNRACQQWGTLATVHASNGARWQWGMFGMGHVGNAARWQQGTLAMGHIGNRARWQWDMLAMGHVGNRACYVNIIFLFASQSPTIFYILIGYSYGILGDTYQLVSYFDPLP